MAFYKTNDPAVLAAWADYVIAVNEQTKVGQAFAAKFPGAKALWSTSMFSGRRFFGLTFDKEMPQPFWTKPDRKYQRSQFPRRTIPAGFKGEERKRLQAELDVLKAEWKEGHPEGVVPFDPFLATMGINHGDLFFAGYKQAIVDGWVYIDTTIKVGPAMVEIFGSEFEAAFSKKAA